MREDLILKINRAVQYFQSGKYQEALREVEDCSKDSASEKLFNLKGLILYKMHNLEESLSAFNEALNINPNSASTYSNMGTLFRDANLLEKSIKHFKLAIEKDPTLIAPRFNLGKLFESMGEHIEAKIQLENCEKINPENQHIYYELGRTYQSLCLHAKAKDAYIRCITLDPTHANGHNNLGNVYLDLDELSNARDAYIQCITLDPSHANGHNNLGKVCLDLGDASRSIAHFQRAIELDRKNTDFQFNLILAMKNVKVTDISDNPLLLLEKNIRDLNCHINLQDPKSIVSVTNAAIDLVDRYSFEFETPLSQIFNQNTFDLNCSRHMDLFEKHDIIPRFCFGCYKVQVDVPNILSLIQLVFFTYLYNFGDNLTTKCMIETRENVNGQFKFLVYCNGLEQAEKVQDKLNKDLNVLLKEPFQVKVKHGCSEFSLRYPDFEVSKSPDQQSMPYPKDWSAIEKNYNVNNPSDKPSRTLATLPGLCISDVLIIQKWLKYAAGFGDTSVKSFKNDTFHYTNFVSVGASRLI